MRGSIDIPEMEVQEAPQIHKVAAPVSSLERLMTAPVQRDWHMPETVMEFGPAWECIVKTAAEREADLIVLGARPADGTTHVPWSTVPGSWPTQSVRG
jgi:nucleotide-binding universal stress UspA family protein